MDVPIRQEREQFLADVVNEGRYASAEAAVDESLRLFEERERKLRALREMIDASLAEGGAYTDEELGAYLKAKRAERDTARAASG